ncbi:Uncharacterised protein [[Clostridium] sordellii]|uniref:Phage protein n=1 Tax=Paraclostridium sordellii TaxID=1505 RepID=A0ABM9RQ94_PARSO|nr:hypothetical protein [Paeniclostridium sordellii]CEJ74221.1 hypothetical protein ATCC9714_21091 [[Clostridium] sordellii] [Paeniclostridium sordellii]CEN69763.1 Uncharacterised protein [[Clostridium] sordellii] [Paeniclostridium sordellii]CEN73031.1 Uncharacterised protein [[Clostridium] sordellii] [Paeniclostridium sordellii]CEO25581.1 Uncharacterised protein [[Clostridium] sordellii] [Paeniclostridium sordellii]CEP75376.1 Uncharacterised protein [[Clostridium] sordellii] [Paeniclostridium
MKIYMNYDCESLKFKGFYIDDIHGENIPTPTIEINNDLWKYIQNLTEDFKLKENFESKEIYTLEDICIIEIIPFEYKEYEPTRIDILEQENADLLLDSALKDSKIEQLENDLSDLMLEIATIGGN